MTWNCGDTCPSRKKTLIIIACWVCLGKVDKEALHPFLVCWMTFVLIFYPGIAHEVEIFFIEFILSISIWHCHKSIDRSLVGLQVDLQVSLFIGSSNSIKWFTPTCFPPDAELRIMHAFTWLVNRKIANSTKSLERAVIAVQSFAFQCFNYFLNAVSVRFACVT